MCIRDRYSIADRPCIMGRSRLWPKVPVKVVWNSKITYLFDRVRIWQQSKMEEKGRAAVSYTHLRAHETVLDLVCRLLLEKKKQARWTAALPSYPLVS